MEIEEQYEDEYEVDEYYRTKSGGIYKIIDLDDYGFLYDKFYYQIVKHSKNILDLIEPDDIISLNNMERIFKVIKVDENRIYGAYETLNKENLLKDYKVSIVTHEMFRGVEYKLDENKYNLIKTVLFEKGSDLNG